MRYNVHTIKTDTHTTYAVKFGNKYFDDTICGTRAEAEIIACEWTARWHQRQIDKARNKWEKIHEDNDMDMGMDAWSDVLA